MGNFKSQKIKQNMCNSVIKNLKTRSIIFEFKKKYFFRKHNMRLKYLDFDKTKPNTPCNNDQ